MSLKKENGDATKTSTSSSERRAARRVRRTSYSGQTREQLVTASAGLWIASITVKQSRRNIPSFAPNLRRETSSEAASEFAATDSAFSSGLGSRSDGSMATNCSKPAGDAIEVGRNVTRNSRERRRIAKLAAA